jgi:hypothetical protein
MVVMFGCGLDAVDAPPEPPEIEPYDFRCNWCGNSPQLARGGMYYASLFGIQDDMKFSLETIGGRAQIWRADGRPFDLHVEKSRLFGVDQRGTVMEHAGLFDAQIHVLQGGMPVYNIRIGKAREVATVDPKVKVEVYEMFWHPLNGAPEAELCNLPGEQDANGGLRPVDDEIGDLQGMTEFETVLFEGDYIDRVTKRMSTDAEWDPSWFNFGCAGRTLAKMRLLLKTTGSRPQSEPWELRQATLRMLVGDYCGTGVPYTHHGVSLVWDDNRLMRYGRPPISLEAQWTEERALCIDHTRLPYMWDRMVEDDCIPLFCVNTYFDPGSPLPTLEMMLHDFTRGVQVISASWE